MSKSPYELRTELLQMAMNILREQNHAKHAKVMHAQFLSKADATDPGVTESATTEEIIAEARKLNDFIQTK